MIQPPCLWFNWDFSLQVIVCKKKICLIVIIIKRKRKLGKNYFICLNSEKKCNFKFLGSLLIGQNDSLDVLLFSHYLPSEYILYIYIYPLGSGSYLREGSSIGIRELLQGGIIHLDQGVTSGRDHPLGSELLQGGIIHWDQGVTSGRDHFIFYWIPFEHRKYLY